MYGVAVAEEDYRLSPTFSKKRADARPIFSVTFKQCSRVPARTRRAFLSYFLHYECPCGPLFLICSFPEFSQTLNSFFRHSVFETDVALPFHHTFHYGAPQPRYNFGELKPTIVLGNLLFRNFHTVQYFASDGEITVVYYMLFLYD